MAVCSMPVSAVFGRPAFSAFAAVVSVYECYLLLGNQWPNFIRGLPVLINLYISIRLWVVVQQCLVQALTVSGSGFH